MGICDVLLIISNENPRKMFSNNSKNYGLSYTEDDVNKAPLTLPVLPWENRLMKKKHFHRAIQSNENVFAGLNHMKFCLSGDACF